MDLEPSANIDLPKPSARPKLPEPLPVWLIAIDDVHLPAPARVEVGLDAFYVTMLQFQRDPSRTNVSVYLYLADNFAIAFDVTEPPVERDDMRPVEVQVLSLREAEQKLIDRELEYQRLKGVTAASDTLLLQDPAGNWVSISERRIVG